MSRETEGFISAVKKHYNVNNLSALTEDNWREISLKAKVENVKMTSEFIGMYKDKLKWFELTVSGFPFSEKEIIEFKDYLYMNIVSKHFELSEKFIIDNIDILYKGKVCEYQRISETSFKEIVKNDKPDLRLAYLYDYLSNVVYTPEKNFFYNFIEDFLLLKENEKKEQIKTFLTFLIKYENELTFEDLEKIKPLFENFKNLLVNKSDIPELTGYRKTAIKEIFTDFLDKNGKNLPDYIKKDINQNFPLASMEKKKKLFLIKLNEWTEYFSDLTETDKRNILNKCKEKGSKKITPRHMRL